MTELLAFLDRHPDTIFGLFLLAVFALIAVCAAVDSIAGAIRKR